MRYNFFKLCPRAIVKLKNGKSVCLMEKKEDGKKQGWLIEEVFNGNRMNTEPKIICHEDIIEILSMPPKVSLKFYF